MKRLGIAFAAALYVTSNVSTVAANGRFPESNHVIFSKTDPNLIVLRVTFGLLVSHDRGKTFDFVCEDSIGYGRIEDPIYAITPSGGWVGSTYHAVTRTIDQGCDWGFTKPATTQDLFVDLAANPADGKTIAVLSSTYAGQDDAGTTRYASSVYESKDEGQTFVQIGSALDPTVLGSTIDLTASDPDRVYVSGSRHSGGRLLGVLLTSKDHGTTWTDVSVPLVGGEVSLYIAAVDPRDAEKVYLRTLNSPGAPGRLFLREAVDGAAPTLRLLFTGKAPLEGFALSPDGSKVWVGSPLDGVRVASTTDYAFMQKSAVEAKCLSVNDDGLWACSNEKVGFIVGLSKDDGATFEPRLHFCEIRGPLACKAGSTTADRCPMVWPALRNTLGCSSEDGGTLDSGGADAGVAPTARGSGCDCESVVPIGGWGSVAGAAATMVAGALAILRRSRRRSGSQS